MKKTHWCLVLMGVWYSQACVADFLGVTLGTRFAYQDMYSSCQDTEMESIGINLKGRIYQGRVISASLSNSVDPLMSPMVLTAGELAGIELFKDAMGDYFVSTLPMSARMITFVFFNTSVLSSALGGCKPTLALRTLSPFGAIFKFNPRTAATYLAPVQRFRGQLYDGSPWAAKLGFYQVQTDQ